MNFAIRQRCLSSLHVRTCTMHPTTLCHSPLTYTHGVKSMYLFPPCWLKVSRNQRTRPMCTGVARAQCTTTPQVMHQRKVLVELYQCTKFRVASSKFPESKGAYACGKCTCIAHALCTPSRNDMHHRIMLIELHHCTKFGVDSSKFPRTGGSLSNKA